MSAQKRNNILVVGAGGFLGQSLSRELLKSKDNIFLASRKEMPNFPNATVLVGDLDDFEFCKKIVQNIDTVYYLAGFKKNISVHTKQAFEAFSGNVHPLLNFLKAAKDSSIKTIVYVSSTIVQYANEPSDRVDGYVLGKYANELAVKSFTAQTGVNIKIARSAPIYGVGDSFDPATANLIPAMIRRIDESKTELEVWGEGKRKLQFIYVDDLAKNLVAASTDPANFFEFGDEQSISVNEIVEKVLNLMDKKLQINHDLTKPDKPTQLSKFQNLISPAVDFDAGLSKTLEYYRTIVRP